MKGLDWITRRDRQGPQPEATQAPRAYRLIVSESAVPPAEETPSSEPGAERVVIAGPLGELGLALSWRVAHRLAALERLGCTLEHVSLLLGSARGPQASAARELVARAVLTHLAKSGGELVFVALDASPALRDELLELVNRLLREPEAQRVPIRLRFRRAAEKPAASGVRCSVPAESSATGS